MLTPLEAKEEQELRRDLGGHKLRTEALAMSVISASMVMWFVTLGAVARTKQSLQKLRLFGGE